MKRQGERDQEVPDEKKYFGMLTYDPDVEIVNIIVDFDATTQILTDTKLGTVTVSQIADHNDQGLYLVIACGKFGNALIKYLEPNSDVVDQVRKFEEFGFDPKVLRTIRDAENFRNREREIQFVTQLNHANIAKVLAFLSPDGTKERINAIVIEDAAEGVLKSYVARIGTQFTDRKVKQFALQLADALKYCHELNIMHRDVRPANIYVHWNGNQIKLGNFGYAREDDSDALKTTNKGDDVVYKAPEIIKETELTPYGKSVDVYSYGMVVWYMAHRGDEPFDNQYKKPIKSHTKFKKYLEEGNRPQIRGDLDGFISEVIRRCWINESELDHRPSMPEILQILNNLTSNQHQ